MKHFIFLLLLTKVFSQVTPVDALQRLIEGNDRYVQNAPLHPNQGQEQREALYSKQQPFAAIVGCSDSRAVPELIFDQGVGDLFVVRVAGNVIGPLELDSLEYSVLHLNASVILVMGHENCGAIDAVLQGKTEDIEAVAYLIEPAAREAKKGGSKDLLYRATVNNAIKMKQDLLKTPVIKKFIRDGKVQVHAGYYNLQSGKVDLLDSP